MNPQPGVLLTDTIAAVTPVDEDVRAQAEAYQLTLTKPPRALGVLEDLGNQLCAIAGVCPPPMPEPALACVFAGDHGVQAHHVSPWPQEVTHEMVANMVAGGAGINVLSRAHGCDVQVIDVGTLTPMPEGGNLLVRRIADGTADLATEAAMTVDQARQALEVGIAVANDAVERGYRVLLPGEVGIGNTTPAAALIAVFTHRPASEVTGSGAGAVGEALQRKMDLIQSAIDARHVTDADPLAALAEVGGFEHAAIAGLILGAASHKIPVILDGVIASSAALVAVALCPAAQGYLIAGHAGAEPGIQAAHAQLGLHPLVDLNLRLGEGTGAVSALPTVRASAAILREMATFESAGVSGSDA